MLERRWGQPGFTLMELLISILIMVLLMAVLLPGLRHAQVAADQIVCKNHLRQAGLMTWLYAQDHGGRFPALAFEVQTFPDLPDQAADQAHRAFELRVRTRSLRESGLDAYDPEILICPSDEIRGTIPVRDGQGQERRKVISYGYNATILRDRLRYEDLSPDRTIFFDGSMSDSRGRGRNVQGEYADGVEFARRSRAIRHTDTLNMLHADQRVQNVDSIRPQMIEGR